jgi:hypothetical protein
VTAYYLPDFEGNIDKIYMYQDDTYIGEALNMERRRYNACRAEWTEQDEANYLFQNKQVAKFHKMVKDRRLELPQIGMQRTSVREELDRVEAEIVKDTVPVREEEYEDILSRDWSKAGFTDL